MKNQFVEQINERDGVDSLFLVRDKSLAVAKNGKPYLTLKLMDRTGEIEGRVWDNAEEVSARFGKDDFVRVRGKASLYMGKMQLVVQHLEPLEENLVDLSDFLPVSQFSADQLEAKLREKVATLRADHFRRMMDLFLSDREFMNMYCSAPAAKTMHHVFLGGLLEHSLAVSDLVDDVCGRYPELNRDLLLLGALLHDVGKIAELSYSRSFDYTDEGKLIGHIVLGVEMVDEKVRQVENFPTRDAVLLKHLLLSHHGQYEFGSPKRPKTLEAIVLNFLDDLDSKMNGVRTHMEKNTLSDSPWTSYHRLYDRYFYSGPATADDERGETARTAQEVAPQDNPQPERPRKRQGPLGVSLGERLKGESLDLFPAAPGEEKQDDD